MKAERVETESKEERVMTLEAHMFKAERARARQIWRENALKADLSEAEEREPRAEIEGEEHVRFLGEKIWKAKESRAKHEVDVCEMNTKNENSLEDLSVDLVMFLPEKSSDVLVWYLMGQFDILREKEESLGELPTLRIQDKKKVTAAVKKIRYTQKSTDMQAWHNKAENSGITVNLIH